MKPPPFEYHAPETVEEALALLAEHGDEAKVLAGGQSLVPLLNFRLARPDAADRHQRRRGARRTSAAGTGSCAIGALTRQPMLERSETVAAHWPLLHEALAYVAHAQIRNRGTVGGSVAHADPAAELPVALAALDGRVARPLARAASARSAGEELFVTHLTTSLEPDELLVEVEVPAPPARTGSAFERVRAPPRRLRARRRGGRR